MANECTDAPQETIDDVVDVLEEQAVADINFQFGNLRVRNIDRIAGLVRDGRIAICVKNRLPRSSAEYPPRSDMICVSHRNVRNKLSKIAIVHEAVHAHFDLNQTAGFALGEEAAAFVAERVYANNAGITYSTSGSPILAAALRLVRDYSVGAGSRVDPEHYQQLWRALSRSRSYRMLRNVQWDNNGIP